LALEIIRLRFAEREEFKDWLVRFFRRSAMSLASRDQRLAFPLKPEIAMKPVE